MFSDRIPLLRWLVLIAVVLVRAALPTAQTERPATLQGLPSETPAQFTPMTQSFDYVKRDVMIPMARRCEAAHDHPRAEGRTARADPADAHAVRGEGADRPREQHSSRALLKHPSYDSFWRDQAMDKILGAQPLKVPVMLVDSLWDQEDIYGAIAVYKAIKPKDTNSDKVFLVMGPWSHGQEIHEGSSLGAIKFGTDTALYFRQHILGPFLAHYLKDNAVKADVPPVFAFETGTNTWRRLPSWPAGCESGCRVEAKPLYLSADRKVKLDEPKSGTASF